MELKTQEYRRKILTKWNHQWLLHWLDVVDERKVNTAPSFCQVYLGWRKCLPYLYFISCSSDFIWKAYYILDQLPVINVRSRNRNISVRIRDIVRNQGHLLQRVVLQLARTEETDILICLKLFVSKCVPGTWDMDFKMKYFLPWKDRKGS